MFIQHLNTEQQSALYHFSKQLISADGHIDERETLLLKTIVSQCSNSLNLDLGASFPLEQLSELFKEQPQKIAFLIELVGVAYADQVLQESEVNFLRNITEALGIELIRLEEIKEWVQQQMQLVEKAQKLLEK